MGIVLAVDDYTLGYALRERHAGRWREENVVLPERARALIAGGELPLLSRWLPRAGRCARRRPAASTTASSGSSTGWRPTSSGSAGGRRRSRSGAGRAARGRAADAVGQRAACRRRRRPGARNRWHSSTRPARNASAASVGPPIEMSRAAAFSAAPPPGRTRARSACGRWRPPPACASRRPCRPPARSRRSRASPARRVVHRLPDGHRLVHPAAVEVRADRPLEVVDERVHLLVGRRPVELAVARRRRSRRARRSRCRSAAPSGRGARPRAGLEAHVARGHARAAALAGQVRVDRAAAVAVAHDARRPVGRVPAVAPLHQRDEHAGRARAPSRSGGTRSAPGAPGSAARSSTPSSTSASSRRGEHVARDAEAARRTRRSAARRERLAQDQQRPALADQLERAGDRAVLAFVVAVEHESTTSSVTRQRESCRAALHHATRDGRSCSSRRWPSSWPSST